MIGKNRRALKTYLLASVGLVALTSAFPANAAKKLPAAAPVDTWSWSGIYIGGHAGYGWARDPFSFTTQMGDAPPLTLPGLDANGFLAGFQAGANWQAGSWVGGLEIDLSATGIKGSTSATTGLVPGAIPLTSVSNTQSQTDKLDWVGSARVRVGYLLWPNVLLYGTGGPAWARIVETQGGSLETISALQTLIQDVAITTPTWRLGVAAGLGVETRVGSSNWLGRVEYLHYDFGKESTFALSDGVGLASGNLTLDVVRAGLAYKLGQSAGFAGPAAGKAMPLKAPRAAAAPWTWSGFYLGGHVGFGWGHDPIDVPNQGFSGAITRTGIQSNGLVGGFQAGANWQAKNAWVGGIEIDLSGSGIKGSNTYAVPLARGLTGTDTLTQSDAFTLIGSARARVGYLLWPQTLLYGTGGLAWTRFAQETDEAVHITAGPQPSVASAGATVVWESGWVVGGGVEARLWNSSWLGRIEYLHYDFGDQGSSFDNTGTVSSFGHPTIDMVRGSLSYKFDWRDPTTPAVAPAMPLKARPTAAVAAADWSGFYVGGHAGYGRARDPVSHAVFGDVILFGVLQDSTNSNGIVGGFQAGANWQVGDFASGIEIDLSATNIKGSSGRVGLGLDPFTGTQTDRFTTLGSARARAGYLARPDLLLYGTGGLAWTRLEQLLVFFNPGDTNGGTTPSWEFGWVAGGGAEVRLPDPKWFLRAEYLHYDFGDSGSTRISTITMDTATHTAVSVNTSGHLTADVVRGGLSYKLY